MGKLQPQSLKFIPEPQLLLIFFFHYFPSSSAITSPNLGGSSDRVTETFIPKESTFGNCTLIWGLHTYIQGYSWAWEYQKMPKSGHLASAHIYKFFPAFKI